MRNTSRVAKNAISTKVVAMEKEGAKFEDVRELVAGARGKMVYATGDADEGIWSAGQVQGLIHDIPTCAELVSRIMREAEAIMRERLRGHDVRRQAPGRGIRLAHRDCVRLAVSRPHPSVLSRQKRASQDAAQRRVVDGSRNAMRRTVGHRDVRRLPHNEDRQQERMIP